MNPKADTTRGGAARMAAIISALGPDAVARLGNALGPAERRALSQAQETAQQVSPEERRRLLSSLATSVRNGGQTAARPSSSAPVLKPQKRADESASDSGRDIEADAEPRVPTRAARPEPFAFLADVDPSVVTKALQGESPSIIALVATLAPEKPSQDLLGALPTQTRHEVALAIADLGRPCPGVVGCLSDSLRERVATLQADARLRHDGVQTVVRALSVASEDVIRQSLSALRVKNPDLADDVVRELERVVSSGAMPVATLVPPAPTPDVMVLQTPSSSPVRHVPEAVSRGVLIPVADVVG